MRRVADDEVSIPFSAVGIVHTDTLCCVLVPTVEDDSRPSYAVNVGKVSPKQMG